MSKRKLRHLTVKGERKEKRKDKKKGHRSLAEVVPFAEKGRKGLTRKNEGNTGKAMHTATLKESKPKTRTANKYGIECKEKRFRETFAS